MNKCGNCGFPIMPDQAYIGAGSNTIFHLKLDCIILLKHEVERLQRENSLLRAGTLGKI